VKQIGASGTYSPSYDPGYHQPKKVQVGQRETKGPWRRYHWDMKVDEFQSKGRFMLKMTRLVLLILFAPTIAAAADVSAVSWSQLSPPTSPAARSYPAMAYDPVSKRVVLFGGYSAKGYLNDTWTFDGTTWTQESPSVAPSVRTAAGIAADRAVREHARQGSFPANSVAIIRRTLDPTSVESPAR
jgi:hypothetical protein